VSAADFSSFVEQVGQPFTTTVPEFAMPAVQRSHSSVIVAVLVFVWAAGFVTMVCRWTLRWRRIRASVRKASPFDLPIGLPVKSSAAFGEPGVFGIFRPALLLPDGVADCLTAREMDAIVAHELCHIRRRDNLVTAIHMAVEALFWFHPLVWWVGARLMEERERACDEEVLRTGGDPHAYAEGILKICELYLASPLACVAGVTGGDLKRRIEAIMTNRTVLKLNFAKKVALVSVGAAALALPIVVGVVNAPLVRAQSMAPTALATRNTAEGASATPVNADVQAATSTVAPVQASNPQGGRVGSTEKPLSFDVASIKPNNSPPGGRGGPVGGSVRFTEEGVVGRKATLRRIIQAAYRLTEYQVSGGPGWLDSDTFDVEAKTETPANKDQLRQMLQTLLADRFKLAAHRGTREILVYFLTVGKNGPGPTLHELKDGEPPPELKGITFGGSHQVPGPTVIMRGTLQDFAIELSGPPFSVGRLVVDKTNLHGTYVGFLHWGEDGDDAISALRDEFALKLESQKAPAEILVIDHAERPSEN